VFVGDGAVRWCQFSNRALFDDDGQLVEWQSVGRDITERRQLEADLARASERFQDLYDNAPCGYYALDRHGKYVHINQQTLSWLGASREEVVGKLGVADFLDAEGQALFAKYFPILQATGKIGPLELTLLGKGAAPRRVSVSATALALIGLFNIAGSLTVGALSSRYRMKSLLAIVYGSRALIIAIYVVAPKTALTFYLLAAVLGFTWLATVPPTAGLVGKLFGMRYLSTLFGLTLLSHQVGGFFGAWLGGLSFVHFGDYSWMWYADIVLAAGAALINLPIREAHVVRVAPAPVKA